MKAGVLVLRVVYGLLFIASAILKLMPIEAFELVLIKQVGVSWEWVALFSRAIIGFELLLGLALVLGFCTKRVTIVSLALLAVFSVFLASQLLTGNGDENCGCFGELIPMDATTSLIKNLVFAGLGVFVLLLNKVRPWSMPNAFPMVGYIGLIFLLFNAPYPETVSKNVSNDSIKAFEQVATSHQWNLEQGEHFILVFLADCIHCKQVANTIAALDLQNTENRFKILVYGNEDRAAQFVEENGISDFEVHHTNDRNILAAINGTFPTMVLIDSSKISGIWVGAGVNSNLFAKYFGQ